MPHPVYTTLKTYPCFTNNGGPDLSLFWKKYKKIFKVFDLCIQGDEIIASMQLTIGGKKLWAPNNALILRNKIDT